MYYVLDHVRPTAFGAPRPWLYFKMCYYPNRTVQSGSHYFCGLGQCNCCATNQATLFKLNRNQDLEKVDEVIDRVLVAPTGPFANLAATVVRLCLQFVYCRVLLANFPRMLATADLHSRAINCLESDSQGVWDIGQEFASCSAAQKNILRPLGSLDHSVHDRLRTLDDLCGRKRGQEQRQ